MIKKDISFSKHILISGGSESERHRLLKQIVTESNLETVIFPKSMKYFSEYVETVKRKGLYHPYYESVKKFNSNQIFDFHLDWIAENNCLFVFEEFQQMEDNWKSEILRILINNLEANRKTAVKFVLTIDDETHLVNILKEIVYKTEYKTKEQIVESNLQIIKI